MKCLSIGCFLVLLLASWLAHAQDSTTAATGAESPEESGAVQVGAGSRGDVTTGSSGGRAAENPVVAPEAPGFALAPPSHPFLGPGLLEVRTPERLRCELIGHDNARRRCEAKAAWPH
jgi:hypothetical protein